MIHNGRARNISSIMNRTDVLGSMAGSPSTVGRSRNVSDAIRSRASNARLIPSGVVAARAYLLANNLLTRNPAGSGGVGKISNGHFKFVW